MSNVYNTSKRSGVYHLKEDIQAINSILMSNNDILSKCVYMWPHIDNLCVYESLVNPAEDVNKKNASSKIDYLSQKMKDYQILDKDNKVRWKEISYDQSLILYGLFVDIFFGVM